MDNRVYWIWLQNAFGPGSAKPMQLVSRAGSAAAFYKGGVSLWSSFSFVSDKELTALNTCGLPEAEAALEYCLRLGQQVLTPDCTEYPALLSEIYNPPAVLYVRGDLPDFSAALSIGIVGTRKASRAGLNAAREMAYQLALENTVVVSGGALGVDSEAHRGALNGRGRTIAVLPCGLDYPYLMDNAILRREILDSGGALVTEYPMQTPVQRGTFQTRNRLISGLAHGVLVAEAPKKSGALITAKYAVEQNREVFAFVGEDKTAFSGCIGLVEDGASQVQTAQEILKAFAERRKRMRLLEIEQAAQNIRRQAKIRPRRVMLSDSGPEEPDPSDIPAGLSPDAQRLLRVLNDDPKHVSRLEAEASLSPAAVLAALTELELFGLIRTYPGQRFTKS
ncbi:MAG: DNA-processing protein DprA [Hominenteromicrobium sp.]